MPQKAQSDSLFGGLRRFFTEGKQYVLACTASLVALFGLYSLLFKETQKLKKLDWTDPWIWGAVVIALSLAILFPGLVFAFKTLPKLRQKAREQLLVKTVRPLEASVSAKQAEADYFLIGPYPESRHDRYDRADKVHLKILTWLEERFGQSTQSSIAVLSGSSGTGKTSLIEAYVAPGLRKRGITALLIRGGERPIEKFREALLSPGKIWKQPTEELRKLGLHEILKRAVHRSPLLVVFDQFEELITLEEEQGAKQTKEFLHELRANPIEKFQLLVSVRSDYFSLLEPLGLPALSEGDNWQIVPPFSYSASQTFLASQASGVSLAPERLKRVLSEAAAADGTKGFIRPIILNMLGRVLIQIADSPAAEEPTRTLLLHHLREAVEHPLVKAVARAVLPYFLTEADTKSAPRSLGFLSENTEIDPYAIEGCLLTLETHGYVRPISRPEAVSQRQWVVSHDFVARLMGQVLKTPFVTFWERANRFLYPLSLTVCCIGAITFFALAPWLMRVHTGETPLYGFQIDPLDSIPSLSSPTTVIQTFLPATDGFAPNINVQIQPYTGTIKDFAKTSKSQFEQMKWKLVSDQQPNNNEWNVEYTGSFQGSDLHFYARAVSTNGKVYLITAVAKESQWTTLSNTLRKHVESFKTK